MKCKIKIGVAGAHSTGKTSFVSELRVALESAGLSVGTVADLATAARDRGFPILRDHTFESTAWIISHGIALELEAGLHADVIVVDRPVADALGYLWAALQSRNAQVLASHDTYLRDLVALHSRTYDHLLLSVIDPAIPIDTTKERDRDPAFRQLAEQGIMTVFEQLHLEHGRLPSNNRHNVISAMVENVSRTLGR